MQELSLLKPSVQDCGQAMQFKPIQNMDGAREGEMMEIKKGKMAYRRGMIGDIPVLIDYKFDS
jgi:hypothetical protein